MSTQDQDDAINAAKARMHAAREARAAFKSFLESTPANISLKVSGLLGHHHPQAHGNSWSVPPPDLELFCETDGGPRFFASDSGYIFPEERTWKFVHYTCKNCRTQTKTFALMVDQTNSLKSPADVEVMKVGEFPPFGAPVSARIAKLLGKDDLELFRKGMRSEAQGLGVGAASYFRRIVDNQWK